VKTTAKPWLTPAYRDYLSSDEWALVRVAALARANYRCARCMTTFDLQVHHITYDRLGHELPEDVMVLCDGCHDKEHRRQAWNRRVAAVARARYGDDWQDLDVWDEVNEWLERQDG
jgi:5-methylcytosine-specific restriction endonuclease McrA